MHSYSALTNVSFVLSLGDNFYPNGVESVDDYRFTSTFTDVYLKNDLKNTPWFIIAGNHDHRQRKVDYQIEYSKRSKIWKFPDYIHILELNIKSKRRIRTVKFIMIDTTIMCNLYEFNNPYPNSLNQTYFNLLDDILRNKLNKKDLKILVGHHPVYTAMEKRWNHQNCINQHVLKLIKTYSINSYISGHDHTLQYSSTKSNRINDNSKLIHLFITGAGKELYNSSKVNNNLVNEFRTEFYYSKLDDDSAGFMTISIYLNKFIVNFLNARGDYLFNKEIYF